MKTFNLKGIWISNAILLSDLSAQEKIIFSIIDYLHTNANSCFASNSFFAKYCNLSKTRISLHITSLVDKGYIKRYFVRDDDKKVKKRILIPINKNENTLFTDS